ncbi:MAG: proline racemase family protein [Bacteroidetes bacterium]|nr:proline racemase family protein [Bacteroidota bacterium]MCY4205385.1 proline racemase family protein [Bacteroidota bacterium]
MLRLNHPSNSTKLDFDFSQNWFPKGSHIIKCIDSHTEGEPLRVILAGYPQPSGHTILARRQELETKYDAFRTALMWEPRGHADMYGCLITEPVSEDAHFGVLFLHNEGYSTMCGHGIIAVTTVVLETGMLPKSSPETQIVIDTPAGLVTAWARIENDSVRSVRFKNVPSYAHAIDQSVNVPDIGRIQYDIGYGGAYYAYVDAGEIDLTTGPDHYSALIRMGKLIKKSITASSNIIHPYEPDLGFLYGTIFVGPAESDDAHSRHVCVFADGEVDRSPTGTGVSGRLALLHAKGFLKLRESIRIESIINSSFTGTVTQECSFGPYNAIIPEVEGQAFITGQHTFILNPQDPFRDGFLLR